MTAKALPEGTITWRTGRFVIWIMPRSSFTRKEFQRLAPPNTIALDGVVSGGPYLNPVKKLVNFDHHDGVVREATMSTAMQAYMAIKGGLMDLFREGEDVNIWVNDTDQDATLATWLLVRYKQFENTQSIPHINRLLTVNDRWDITGGAFPMSLDSQIVRQHSWVFRPYTELRKSGGLAVATGSALRDNLEAMFERLNRLMMGQADEVELDTRHEILYQGPHFWVVDEIGGNEARYWLWSQGMKAFVSIVARRPDGRMVCSIGRRSRYITSFPLPLFYAPLNEAEGLSMEEGWDGSDIVGGSSRLHGTGQEWEGIRDILENRIATEGLAA